MAWLHPISIGKQIAFILGIFFIWCAISAAWYVCGVNGLCGASAHAAEQNDVVVQLQLSDTQLPLPMAYDRAGASADIFIMLLIAFVLGTLLGRILAAPKTLTSLPPIFSLPSGTEKERIPERVGTPVHISEFIRKVPAAQQKPTVTIITPPPKPLASPVPAPKPAPVFNMPKTEAKKEDMPIILGAAKTEFAPKFAVASPVITSKPAPFMPKAPAPAFQKPILMPPEPKSPAPVVAAAAATNTQKPQQQQGERPKLKFNTSWNNPYRDDSNLHKK